MLCGMCWVEFFPPVKFQKGYVDYVCRPEINTAMNRKWPKFQFGVYHPVSTSRFKIAVKHYPQIQQIKSPAFLIKIGAIFSAWQVNRF